MPSLLCLNSQSCQISDLICPLISSLRSHWTGNLVCSPNTARTAEREMVFLARRRGASSSSSAGLLRQLRPTGWFSPSLPPPPSKPSSGPGAPPGMPTQFAGRTGGRTGRVPPRPRLRITGRRAELPPAAGGLPGMPTRRGLRGRDLGTGEPRLLPLGLVIPEGDLRSPLLQPSSMPSMSSSSSPSSYCISMSCCSLLASCTESGSAAPAPVAPWLDFFWALQMPSRASAASSSSSTAPGPPGAAPEPGLRFTGGLSSPPATSSWVSRLRRLAGGLRSQAPPGCCLRRREAWAPSCSPPRPWPWPCLCFSFCSYPSSCRSW
mmetsp:Transcript_30203/g.66995  ORF Transcript_30203/g.66995 Transcript_30203/m.66995 type:complete len:321 (+) Transcript_30203:3684-4646(+)